LATSVNKSSWDAAKVMNVGESSVQRVKGLSRALPMACTQRWAARGYSVGSRTPEEVPALVAPSLDF
jgi:hypothetical protein